MDGFPAERRRPWVISTTEGVAMNWNVIVGVILIIEGAIIIWKGFR